MEGIKNEKDVCRFWQGITTGGWGYMVDQILGVNQVKEL